MNRQETRAKWAEICKKWDESKQSQREYCETIGIKLGTFKYHLTQMRGAAESRRFLPVRVEDAKQGERKTKPYCTIEFSENGRIVIESERGLLGLKGLINGRP